MKKFKMYIVKKGQKCYHFVKNLLKEMLMYEDIICAELKSWQQKLEKLALDIWANPEKPNREYKACKWTAELLREAGFTTVEVYGDRSFEAPQPGEQRIYFYAQKG